MRAEEHFKDTVLGMAILLRKVGAPLTFKTNLVAVSQLYRTSAIYGVGFRECEKAGNDTANTAITSGKQMPMHWCSLLALHDTQRTEKGPRCHKSTLQLLPRIVSWFSSDSSAMEHWPLRSCSLRDRPVLHLAFSLAASA